MNRTSRQTPLWMTALIIIFLLPSFAFPFLVANIPQGNEAVETFVWIYPFYMLLSAWLAWNAYPGRPHISWILIILMVLSTAAIWTLEFLPMDA